MQRTWLSERVADVENASRRYEQSKPKTGCQAFLKQFEKQLQQKLHLKNFIPNGILSLSIEKGCFTAATEFMDANGVHTSKGSTFNTNECECVNLVLLDHKLYMTSSIMNNCEKS